METSTYGYDVQIPWSRPSKLLPSKIFAPQPFGQENLKRSKNPNYGGLTVYMFEEAGLKRMIVHDPHLDEGKFDRPRPKDDTNDYYYNLDDDNLRNTYRGWDDDKIYQEKRCRRTNWHRILPVNCNTFHEFDIRTVAHLGGLTHVGYVHVSIQV